MFNLIGPCFKGFSFHTWDILIYLLLRESAVSPLNQTASYLEAILLNLLSSDNLKGRIWLTQAVQNIVKEKAKRRDFQ